MNQHLNLNPLSRLWNKLSSNALLCVHLSEFMKVAKSIAIQIMGSMEDERIFSTLTFMNTRLWNRLYEHLDLVFCMFVQPFYIVDTFSCDDAIMSWIEGKIGSLVQWWCSNLQLVMYYVYAWLGFWKHHGCYYNLCWQLSSYNPWQLLSMASNMSLLELYICLLHLELSFWFCFAYCCGCLVVQIYEEFNIFK